ncbi:MAG: hypothetical protein ABIG61_14180, partial [Planctomycetota bacterium]
SPGAGKIPDSEQKISYGFPEKPEIKIRSTFHENARQIPMYSIVCTSWGRFHNPLAYKSQ